MHIGNLRTALFNWLAARSQSAGRFLLRIEDTDRERHDDTYVTALLEDLRWLGLLWEEGPEIDAAPMSYYQSNRLEIYQAYYDQLLATGQAYHCFCSEETLALSRQLQLASGQAPKYQGGCWQLSPQDVLQRQAAQSPSVIRFRVPLQGEIQFTDLVRGDLCFPLSGLGDFIIRRSTDMPSFMFANAVDDALMGVTHALRGEDHLTNTPRQLLIQRTLGLASPLYGHMSMVHGHDGQPLSKRNGSVSVRQLRQQGYLPGAILNYLARLGHHHTHADYLTQEGLAEQFRFQSLVKAPAKFDPQQLDVWQKKAMQHLPSDDFWELLPDDIKLLVPSHQQTAFIDAIRPNLMFIAQARSWAQILFGQLDEINDVDQQVLTQMSPEFFQLLAQNIPTLGCDYDALCQILKDRLSLRGRALFLPLRLIFTGVAKGPEMHKLLPLIGSQRALSRVQAWL